MSRPVVVIGLGAEGPSGLSTRARDTLASATFLAGGKRHLALVGPSLAETFTIGNNVDELIERLRRRGQEEHCVVLASGDPMFYGIGHALSRALGRDQIVVEPAVSSLQLAFARAGLSWHDAAVGTIHGRPLKAVLLPLLGHPKIGLFTQDGGSPSAVAAFFHERGLKDYLAIVSENLATPNEQFLEAPLADLLSRRFGDLNILILIREPAVDATPPVLTRRVSSPPDSLFAKPENAPVLLTHMDVRAVVLSRFWGLPEGPIWDIGAGLGGVSVGLARSFPDREVVAVEQSAVQGRYLETNRTRFGAYNLRIIAGTAPSALKEEDENPAGVFVGGTGGVLDAVLDLVLDRLQPRGILVANFVGLENLGRCLDRLRGAGWMPEVSQVSLSHGQDLAGLTVLTPERPVWIVRGVRPFSDGK
jgi:precorrin-6Y C5,15-methyltransferase (decarboxylating)